MARGASQDQGISRRRLLIGGGAGLGLVVAWALWPRDTQYLAPMREGETAFGPWIRIAGDGRVFVSVPVVEHGQGIFTALALVVADELGADWRTIGVEPGAIAPYNANPLAAAELFGPLVDAVPVPAAARAARDVRTMLTAGSSGIRQFEAPMREAAAMARVLLCKAAARVWSADWTQCSTAEGFVVLGEQRLRFGEIAERAASENAPADAPLRNDESAGRLVGTAVPRLDTPAKVDGSANFAADIRLPGMVFASVRHGPLGQSRLLSVDRAAADAVPGAMRVVTTDRWVAAVATDWWAANRAADALKPRFETALPVSGEAMSAALTAAIDGPGDRIASAGDLAAAFRSARVLTADYHAAPGLHVAIEPVTATALFEGGRLRLWAPTLAPAATRSAVARVLGIGEDAVTVIPMQAGGSFGAGLETRPAEQAALIAREVGRPVQLTWTRGEDMAHLPPRPPAMARMTGRLDREGRLAGWLAKIATPATGREIFGRLFAGDAIGAVARGLPGAVDPMAVAGGEPFYAIPSYALDHHPADIGMATGHLRGGAHGYTAFFTESFLDEMAAEAEMEPSYFRIAMLGQNARLANCINTVASLGSWQGGIAGSGQGIACHQMRGSRIAVLAEARIDAGRVRCDRLVAAVDCGRVIHPDLVLQQIESGLMFGLMQATGCATRYSGGLAEARRLADVRLPMLSEIPEISIEIIRSDAEPGGVAEIGVAPVAPAIANAVVAASGIRLRRLPLDPANP
ncbi:molybdopterin cofactor-binding domain-containing protein [Sphingomonas sp.]